MYSYLFIYNIYVGFRSAAAGSTTTTATSNSNREQYYITAGIRNADRDISSSGLQSNRSAQQGRSPAAAASSSIGHYTESIPYTPHLLCHWGRHIWSGKYLSKYSEIFIKPDWGWQLECRTEYSGKYNDHQRAPSPPCQALCGALGEVSVRQTTDGRSGRGDTVSTSAVAAYYCMYWFVVYEYCG